MSVENLMSGFPPAENDRVTLGNWRFPPFNKWGLQHVREIMPTSPIAHNPDTVRPLDAGDPISLGFSYAHGGASITLADMIENTHTDGLLILRQGRVVLEEYRNDMTPATKHILFSVSKSVTAMLVGVLVGRGKLNPDAPITDYIPEMKDTGYGDATVRHLLDMTVGVAFNEDYKATDGLMIKYRQAAGWNPGGSPDPELHTRSFLMSMTEQDAEHGARFRYLSPNTDLLGWVIERAGGARYTDLLSDAIWQPMGAGHEAYMSIDHLGCPRAAGGLCMTLRDLARLGLLLSEGGKRDGKEVIPAEWIDDIRRNGNRDQWMAGDYANDYSDWPMRYRSKCYVMDEFPSAMMGIGIHGQFLFVDP
ncbi:MAG: serine hydrolase, partial [Rhodospirillales bacterium]|nr:serine hydrolase [Rhodospirillales bacterium]